jgi:hypothetical protein
MSAESARGVQPLVDTRWLALPLSARGLVEELAKIVDDDGALATCLPDIADAHAIGNELARLLCAHRGEYARVRRDAARLIERGVLSFEGSFIRLNDRSLHEAAVVAMVRKSTSTIRMRHLRARQETARRDALSASQVTTDGVTSDAARDGGDASHVTRALSLNQNNLSLNKERVRDARDARRWIARDMPFSERAREIAAKVRVAEPELTWMAFTARYAEKKITMDWDRLWETYVVREKKWEKPESANRSANGPSVTPAVDLDAPWLRTGSESS